MGVSVPSLLVESTNSMIMDDNVILAFNRTKKAILYSDMWKMEALVVNMIIISFVYIVKKPET